MIFDIASVTAQNDHKMVEAIPIEVRQAVANCLDHGLQGMRERLVLDGLLLRSA